MSYGDVDVFFRDGNVCCVYGPRQMAVKITIGTASTVVVIGQPFSMKFVFNCAAIYGDRVSVRVEEIEQ